MLNCLFTLVPVSSVLGLKILVRVPVRVEDDDGVRSLNLIKAIMISVSDPDPLHLAGSGSTSIPAPDPDTDPDPLRFLSSDPDPLKKALIWIRVAPI